MPRANQLTAVDCSSRVGRKLPAHATALGKAILAESTPAEVQQRLGRGPYPRLTGHTVPDLQQLNVELEAFRSAGYSIEREQNTLGLCCVAAVVPYRIPGTDAISCSMPLETSADEEIERVADIVVSACAKLAKILRAAGIRETPGPPSHEGLTSPPGRLRTYP